MKTTAKQETVKKALEAVNSEYGYRLEFNRADQSGKWFNFTIQSGKSGVPGSRTSHSGRKLKSASWHAHGYLFDKILEMDPQAVIKTAGKAIDINGGNWEDWNCGSDHSPCYISKTSIL